MGNNTTARDVFMYLLVVIVLAMSAVNLGTLLFQYVNIYVPDAAIQQCYGSSCTDTIRWALASIVVVFSVLIWARHFLQRDIAQHPEKADSWVRRWMVYFTLFISSVALVADAVGLLYSWLQGDLTAQFILKVFVVFYIAGTIFYYFLKALHPEQKSFANIVVWVAIAVVLASVVVGFATSGSPFRARLERLDEQRLNALQSLQNQIVHIYWQSKGSLPVALADLEDSINGFAVPVDPKTGEPYEYSRKSALSFILCATFETESMADSSAKRPGYPVYDKTSDANWSHGVGRVCFDRTVDPELYPVNEKPVR